MVGQTTKKPVYQSAADRNRICQFSKTKLCRFELLGRCTKGLQCPFAHGNHELREQPDLRCTKMCMTMLQTGSCNDKDCTFAHSKSELRSAWSSSSRKTKLCRNELMTGQCTLGSKCNYVHAARAELPAAIPQSVEEKTSASPMKITMSSAVTAASFPSLVETAPPLPPLPPLPPFAPHGGLYDSFADFNPGYANFNGSSAMNFNGFNSGFDAAYDSYARSTKAEYQTFTGGRGLGKAQPREPAYVPLTAPDYAVQSQISGDSEDGFDFNFTFNFLDFSESDDVAPEEPKGLSMGRSDLKRAPGSGWPMDQPASPNSSGCSVDSSKDDAWQVKKISLTPVGVPKMRSLNTSESTLSTMSDGEALQEGPSSAIPEFGDNV